MGLPVGHFKVKVQRFDAVWTLRKYIKSVIIKYMLFGKIKLETLYIFKEKNPILAQIKSEILQYLQIKFIKFKTYTRDNTEHVNLLKKMLQYNEKLQNRLDSWMV